MDRPRLLFVNNWTKFFLSHRAELAQAATAAGYDVHVAAPDEPEREDIERLGFPFHVIPLARKSLGPLQESRTVLSLVSLFRRLRPELVHNVAMKAVLYGATAARIARVPAVVNAFTGLGWLFSDTPSARLALTLVKQPFRFSLGHQGSRTIFQNTDDLELFVNLGLLPRHRTMLIRGSGVDPIRFDLSEEPVGPPLVVLPARVLWSKGVREYLEAARIVKVTLPETRFALVGDCDLGNPTAVPRAQIETWVQEGIVEWWGHRSDMASVLRQAHVVCLPSHREGLPKALLEAAACGRPMVATDVPGCRDAVVDGITGTLVPPNDPVRLATALEALLRSKSIRQQMGCRARERFLNEFTLSKVLDATLGLYSDLLVNDRHKRPSIGGIREQRR